MTVSSIIVNLGKVSPSKNDGEDKESDNILTNNDGEEEEQKNLYKVEDKPPFLLSFFSALQICICQLLFVLWLPLILTPFLCMLPADPIRVHLVSTALLSSGVVTILQSIKGIRLPTVASPSAVYTRSLLSMLYYTLSCPCNGDLLAMGHTLRTERWQTQLREVQGDLLFMGGLQTCLGLSGLLPYLSKKISPEMLAPTVIVAGFSFFQEPLNHLMKNCTLSALSVNMIVMMIFLGLTKYRLPLPTFSMKSGLKVEYFLIFRMFPVVWTCIISCILVWITSALSFSSSYPDEVVAFEEAVDNADWFHLPNPFAWGLPTLSMVSVLQMLPAFFMQSIISIAMFHGNADVCEAGIPPPSAVKRGFTVEGIGLLFGALWGHGVTSNPSSVALTYFTGVASRSSTVLAAILMICLSFFTSFILLISKIPISFLAIIQLVLHCGLICIGISMLKNVNLSSQRSRSIIGFSLALGWIIPRSLDKKIIFVDTGFWILDIFIKTILERPPFVALFTGCLLDSLLPGKKKGKKIDCKKIETEDEDVIYKPRSWQELFCSFLDHIELFPEQTK